MKQDDADYGRRGDLLTTDEEKNSRCCGVRISGLRSSKRYSQSYSLVRARGRHDSAEAFGFVKAYQAEYSVSTLCRLHNVSESGYYAWLKRMPSFRKLANLALGDRIEAMYRKSRSTYGRPRIQAELVDEGIRVGDKRVARLMRERHCHGASRRKWIVTTTHNRDATTARDSRKARVHRDAAKSAMGRRYHLRSDVRGLSFVAVVLDVCSRRIVGWSMANHMRKELVIDALDMAIFRRGRKQSFIIPTMDHNTRRSRSASAAKRPALRLRWARSETATTTRCAKASTLHSSASFAQQRFKTQREASLAVFDFIEGWYNPRRRHSALGYLSPNQFERRMGNAA
jgi:putative transposase